jgi:hypothetical protein
MLARRASLADRVCPWCGFSNLDVYVYCQRCGRGFSTEKARAEDPQRQRWTLPDVPEPAPKPVVEAPPARRTSGRKQKKLFGFLPAPRR